MRIRTGLILAALAAVAVSACTSSGGSKPPAKTGYDWFQARPLIMAGQPAKAPRSNPFGSLKVPTTEDAYNKLSQTQQTALANALRGVDCAHPPQLANSPDRVACDPESDAFLLGAELFTGNDVTRAKPFPPTESIADWQISLSLTSTAAKTMYRWTTGHHLTVKTGAFNDVQTGSEPPCGATTPTPCADFAAIISDGVVVTIPVWFSALKSTVVIEGFNRATATGISHKLTT